MAIYQDHAGKVVQVTRGLGDWWICARGRHRVKSPALPPRRSREECQQDLDAYAAKQAWKQLDPMPRHPASVAWDEWLAGNDGVACSKQPVERGPYLVNRLWRAFQAGWDAARLHQQRQIQIGGKTAEVPT